jgi:hypothetical protein
MLMAEFPEIELRKAFGEEKAKPVEEIPRPEARPTPILTSEDIERFKGFVGKAEDVLAKLRERVEAREFRKEEKEIEKLKKEVEREKKIEELEAERKKLQEELSALKSAKLTQTI